MPVHLFGQPCDMDRLMALANAHKLHVVEDCAQSFGAKFGDRHTGSFGDTGCFSFFPSKNLGAFGDGGLVTTSNSDVAERLRVFRNHGSRKQYYHDEIGYNSRLDEMQAAILRQKLPHIDAYNAGRRRVAHRYYQNLSELSMQLPVEANDRYHVYHQYTLLTDQREAIQAALRAEDIASAIYYPVPLHQQRAIINSGANTNALPIAESVSEQCLSLPMYPELSDDNVDRICSIIKQVVS